MIEMGRWMMGMMMSHSQGFNTKIGVCLFLMAKIESRQNINIYIGHWPTEAMLARNFGLGRYLQLWCKCKVYPYLRIFQGVPIA